MGTYRQQSKIIDLLDVFLELDLDIKGEQDVELVAERAREGLKLIEELSGRIDTEEVLGIIFKSFCIGK
jgi:tRNA U34 5-carboxymethylaminomethyl modifying GTPase MnmE/TrmE